MDDENICLTRLQYASLGIFIILGVTGIIGNILVGIVIHFKMKRNNPNFMLKVSCINYTCMMLGLLSVTITSCFWEDTLPAMWLFLLLPWTRFTSEWILVCVSCARTISFIWPQKAALLWSNVMVYGSVLMVLVTGTCLQIPTAMHVFQNIPVPPFRLFTTDKSKYQLIYHTFCAGMVPMVLLILSLLMMKKKYLSLNATSQRQPDITTANSPRAMDQINDINKLMTALVLTLIICHLPVSIHGIIGSTLYVMDMGDVQPECLTLTLYLIFHTAVGLNGSVQILIYIVVSKKFKTSLKALCQ